MDRDTAIRKIQKLWALGNDAGATAAEAERALAQAEAMMRQHNIDLAEVGAQGAATQSFDWGSDFVPYQTGSKAAKTLPPWFGGLAIYVANFTDTIARAQFSRESGYGIGFYGERVDVMFATYLLLYLKKYIWDAAAASGLPAGGAREDFRRGAIARLGERMQALYAERKASYAAGTGTALIVVDQKLVARNEYFGDPEYGPGKERRVRANAYAAGRDAAERAGLGRPLGAQRNATAGALR